MFSGRLEPERGSLPPSRETMASHRSFAAVTACALLAPGCGLDTTGLASLNPLAVEVDASDADTQPAIDAASGASLQEGSPESPELPKSPIEDAMAEGSDAEFDAAAVAEGSDAS